MKIKVLFIDVGGVLLTNGWDHVSRKLACKKFKLDFDPFENLHHLTFDPFERGKITLDDYLDRVVFTKKRNFTRSAFKQFIFSQSKPYEKMIDLIVYLKAKYQLKTVVVSNEGREINAYRIKKFKLTHFIDFFVTSTFVHLLKPDLDIFKMALDLSQAQVEDVFYIENTPMYIDVAKTLGIRGICHKDYETTRLALQKHGLK